LAASSDRKGERIILSKDTAHLLHAAIDVGAPTAVLNFCISKCAASDNHNHQRDSLGQLPIHVAVHIPKESTAGVNPVFRLAKTSTIKRLLQEYPESAIAQDTTHHPIGRYPIHTALLQGHDWFSGVRELTRCAPDILLLDDPVYGLKPFELAKDLETTFQLLRCMPHALEASRRSVRSYLEVHPASFQAFRPSLPEKDFIVTLPTPCSVVVRAKPCSPKTAASAGTLPTPGSFELQTERISPEEDSVETLPTACIAELQTELCSPEEAIPEPPRPTAAFAGTIPTQHSAELQIELSSLDEAESVQEEKLVLKKQRSPGFFSSLGLVIAKAVTKPFHSSPPDSSPQMTYSASSKNVTSNSTHSGPSSVNENQNQNSRSADYTSTSSACGVTKLGHLRRMDFERKMATIIEQPFEDDEEEADSTETTIDVSVSSCESSHGRIEEVKCAVESKGVKEQPRMPSLETSEESQPIDDRPNPGDPHRSSSLRRLRNAFLDRLETKQRGPIEPLALSSSDTKTPGNISAINELREGKPIVQPNPEVSEGYGHEEVKTKKREENPIVRLNAVVSEVRICDDDEEAKTKLRDENAKVRPNSEVSEGRICDDDEEAKTKLREENAIVRLNSEISEGRICDDDEEEAKATLREGNPTVQLSEGSYYDNDGEEATTKLRENPIVQPIAEVSERPNYSGDEEAKTKPGEENPIVRPNPEVSECPNYDDDRETDDLLVGQHDELTPVITDPPIARKSSAQLFPKHDGTRQESKYNKYKNLLNAHPATKRDSRKAWRNDLPY
jgi:hypothetical protein